jgi:hypothetical protein
MQLQQNNELRIYAQPEPEPDQTMAASVWGKSNTSGDIGESPTNAKVRFRCGSPTASRSAAA